MIYIHFKVKLRAFGVTFGTEEKILPLHIPFQVAVLVPSFRTTLYNDHGIFIEAYDESHKPKL